jgi:hypothetical protein
LKISDIRAATVDLTPRPRTVPRVPRQSTDGFVSPMRRYNEYRRDEWHAHWKRAAVVVSTEDGTYGLGFTNNAGPVCEIVNGHFAHLLIGQEGTATEKLWDLMRRSSAPYGTAGLASYAISAVDIALWDLKGKLLGRPVYERGIALAFAREGARVVINDQDADLSRGHAGDVARLIAEAGGEANICLGDASATVDMQRVVAATVDRFGRLDILVNNANPGRRVPNESRAYLDVSEEQLVQGYFLPFKAAYVNTQLAARPPRAVVAGHHYHFGPPGACLGLGLDVWLNESGAPPPRHESGT